MKTHFETAEDARENRKWVLIDATDQVVGRLASQIASILRGKTNPRFTPHNDSGDFVVVVNAGKQGNRFGRAQNPLPAQKLAQSDGFYLCLFVVGGLYQGTEQFELLGKGIAYNCLLRTSGGQKGGNKE